MAPMRKYLTDAMDCRNHYAGFESTNFISFVETDIKEQLIETPLQPIDYPVSSIPILDVKRYLNCVHGFKTLSSMNFVVPRN
ncbi:hypothetical protein BGZ50_006483, partial [Haplosporangium sp. Z 11]